MSQFTGKQIYMSNITLSSLRECQRGNISESGRAFSWFGIILRFSTFLLFRFVKKCASLSLKLSWMDVTPASWFTVRLAQVSGRFVVIIVYQCISALLRPYIIVYYIISVIISIIPIGLFIPPLLILSQFWLR